MKSVFLVFLITIVFLIGMTKFNNNTNYQEALRYMELSQYYNEIQGGADNNGNVFLETVDVEVSFSGQVKSTKTITVSYGTYLSNAISKMGGLKSDADMRCINESFAILENLEFYIPGGKDKEKISINNASEDELTSLTNVGRITAQRIVQYREYYGKYKTLESIMNVSGIGTQTFESIKDDIIL